MKSSFEDIGKKTYVFALHLSGIYFQFNIKFRLGR
jgi:hypothetical protein